MGEDRGCFTFVAWGRTEDVSLLLHGRRGIKKLLASHLEYLFLLAPLSPHSPHGIKSSRILWLPPFKGGWRGAGG